MNRLIIVGAGGHGKVIADVVTASGDTVVGFLDDDVEKRACAGFPKSRQLKSRSGLQCSFNFFCAAKVAVICAFFI